LNLISSKLLKAIPVWGYSFIRQGCSRPPQTTAGRETPLPQTRPTRVRPTVSALKNCSLGRINTHEPPSSGNTHDAALHQSVGDRKTDRRRPCPRSPNLEAAREQQPREKPRPAIALRGFQRTPRAGKLPAHYSNGPPWKTQLPTVLPHSGRRLPRPFRMRHSLGTIHRNQIQETIIPAGQIASQPQREISLNAARKRGKSRKGEGV
jgi:hypothetical protein